MYVCMHVDTCMYTGDGVLRAQIASLQQQKIVFESKMKRARLAWEQSQEHKKKAEEQCESLLNENSVLMRRVRECETMIKVCV